MLLPTKNILRIVGFSTIGLVIIHFLYVFIAIFYTLHQEEHRLLNIRNFPNKYRAEIERAFINSRLHPQKENILFVGTSFTWGYSWQEDAIYTYKIQEAIEGSKNIVNLSCIGCSLEWKIDMLLRLDKMKVKAEKLIIEVNSSNVRNARGNLAKVRSLEATLSEKKVTISSSIPYMDFFLKNPLGISVFPMIFNQYNYFQPDRKISTVPLPSKYYMLPDFLNENRENAERYIQLFAHYGNLIANEVYFFISPIAYEAVSLTGHSEEDIRKTYNIFYAMCEEQKNITCIDTYSFDDSDHFSNVTHLNIRGHKAFADFLMNAVEF